MTPFPSPRPPPPDIALLRNTSPPPLPCTPPLSMIQRTFLPPKGITKRCRLLTNSVLVYEPKCRGGGGVCGVSANEYSCAHGAQKKFGDLTPYLTYAPYHPKQQPHILHKPASILPRISGPPSPSLPLTTVPFGPPIRTPSITSQP
jgi:hypothetical protein